MTDEGPAIGERREVIRQAIIRELYEQGEHDPAKRQRQASRQLIEYERALLAADTDVAAAEVDHLRHGSTQLGIGSGLDVAVELLRRRARIYRTRPLPEDTIHEPQ